MSYNISNLWPSNWWPSIKIEEENVPPISSVTDYNALYLAVGTTALTILLGYVYLKSSCWNKREVKTLTKPEAESQIDPKPKSQTDLQKVLNQEPRIVPKPKSKTHLKKVLNQKPRIEAETKSQSEPQASPLSHSLSEILEIAQNNEMINNNYKSFYVSIMTAKCYCKQKKYVEAEQILETGLTYFGMKRKEDQSLKDQSLIDLTEVILLIEKPYSLLETIIDWSDHLKDEKRIELLNKIAIGCRKLEASQAYHLLEKILDNLNVNEPGWESVIESISESSFRLNSQKIPTFLQDFFNIEKKKNDSSLKFPREKIRMLFDPMKGNSSLESLLGSTNSFSIGKELERLLDKIKIADVYANNFSRIARGILEKVLIESKVCPERDVILEKICEICRELERYDSFDLLENISGIIGEIKDDKKRSAVYQKIISICFERGHDQIPSFLQNMKIELSFKDPSSTARYWMHMLKLNRSNPKKVEDYSKLFFMELGTIRINSERAPLLIELCKGVGSWKSEEFIPILEKVFNLILQSSDDEEYLKVLEYFPEKFWKNEQEVNKYYKNLIQANNGKDPKKAFELTFLIHAIRNKGGSQ